MRRDEREQEEMEEMLEGSAEKERRGAGQEDERREKRESRRRKREFYYRRRCISFSLHPFTLLHFLLLFPSISLRWFPRIFLRLSPSTLADSLASKTERETEEEKSFGAKRCHFFASHSAFLLSPFFFCRSCSLFSSFVSCFLTMASIHPTLVLVRLASLASPEDVESFSLATASVALPLAPRINLVIQLRLPRTDRSRQHSLYSNAPQLQVDIAGRQIDMRIGMDKGVGERERGEIRYCKKKGRRKETTESDLKSLKSTPKARERQKESGDISVKGDENKNGLVVLRRRAHGKKSAKQSLAMRQREKEVQRH